MKIHPEFPSQNPQAPRRRSEGRVYDQPDQSDLPGQALYGLEATPEAPEPDFVIRFQDRARFGLQIKGGR